MTHEERRDARIAKAFRMADLYRQGQTLEVIGEQYGITRERVRQLLKEVGVTAKQGGAAVRAKKKREELSSRLEEKSLRVRGMTCAEFKAIPSKAKRAYAQQRRNAAIRGIEWKFNLASWWRFWSMSGKWDHRGRGQGYCMARKGDSGPYSPDNVYICTIGENFSDSWIWRPSHTRISKATGRPVGKIIEALGEAHCVAEWARIKGIQYSTLQARLDSGLTPEQALTAPLRRTNTHMKRLSEQEQRA